MFRQLSKNSGYIEFYGVNLFEIKVCVAVLSGAVLQYLYGTGRGVAVLLTILASTIFMAVFIIEPSLDYMEVPKFSSIRILVFSLTALISVELISLIIKVLPLSAKKKTLLVLGVDEADMNSNNKED